ncbi:MAG: DUF4159 domain-containing protein [Hyphomicrobiales bacterium]|nr:DUF4159 domain-containing protein [Hyphomicrobiales bacterium]
MIPLGFVQPFILAALALLPVIWWLLRMTPPRPRQEEFPPTRLLFEIERREETPARSPWWLTALRLLLTAIVIVALAGPVWRPATETYPGSGPLLLVVDNGWLAAPDWDARTATAERVIAAADAAERPIMLLPTAATTPDLAATSATETREKLAALTPQPLTPDRAAPLPAIETQLAATPADIVWISDGHENGAGRAFAEALVRLAGERSLEVFATDSGTPLALRIADNAPDALHLEVLRKPSDGSRSGSVRALDLKGRTLAETPFEMSDAAILAKAKFDLPVELRNDIARIEIVDEASAGAVQLLDERWRRRVVGILSGESSDLAQPLLSPLYYVEKALAPYADLRRPRAAETPEAVAELLDQNVSVIVMTDIGNLVGDVVEPLSDWVKKGGLLIRFAGPRLAAGDDPLVPVDLRRGGRVLGGSLSWEQPQQLAPFAEGSPFADLAVPSDVRVSRQVLAEPGPDIAERTYASLADGTPLVTAGRSGAGLVVLFHVTADTTWSSLPLSGTFVEMLRRLVALSAGRTDAGDGKGARETGVTGEALLPPLRALDGFGTFTAPSGTAEPLPASGFANRRPDAAHPPGFYGTEDAFRALNVFGPDDRLTALDLAAITGIGTLRPLSTAKPIDLRPWLFLLALALVAADLFAVLFLNGSFRRRTPGSVTASISAALLFTGLLAIAGTDKVRADETLSAADRAAIEATSETRLAYVLTGNATIDETSRAGLYGLTRILTTRTALEPGDPVGLDIARDDLTFYSLIYWPIDADAEVPPADVMARVDAFMRNGGTVLFDTRDGIEAIGVSTGFGGGAGTLKLREMLANLDIPPLAAVPIDHVLTKSFYLLNDFPGRYRTSQLWVEALPETDEDGRRPARSGDGVSSILITANDFAAAWAIDDGGQALYPTVPSDPSQREFAYRAGVNIVMYALTGNYKADQVHIPALLERLGQ